MKKFLFSLMAIVLMSVNSFGQVTVSISDAQKIGVKHNEYLATMLKNNCVNFECMKTNAMNIKINGLTIDYKEDIVDYFTKNDIKQQETLILSNLKSGDSKRIFSDIKGIIFNAENFSDCSISLDAKLNEVSNLEDQFEKSALYIFIEVSRNSLEFWMPIKNGGKGHIENYRFFGDIDWKAIGYSDGAGAVGSLIRTLALAAGGPLGWGAIVGAIGWGAAWGSGSSLLYQLMN